MNVIRRLLTGALIGGAFATKLATNFGLITSTLRFELITSGMFAGMLLGGIIASVIGLAWQLKRFPIRSVIFWRERAADIKNNGDLVLQHNFRSVIDE